VATSAHVKALPNATVGAAAYINYLGFSYGTYLAQVYTKLFPSHMRRMVLDSNVDARKVWYQANLDQDMAFERNINIWFGWLAKYDSVYHLGTTAPEVRHTWYGVKHSLRKHPVEGIVGPDEWTDVFLYAGYYQSTWLELADVFAGWVNKQDGDAVVNAYKEFDGPGDDNGFAVYNAVQCTDLQWPENWSTWRRDNWRVYKIAPFFTWGNVWFNAPCRFWPAPAKKPLKITGKGVGSALLIDETLDAATPYPGSLYLRSIFKDSVLVAAPGGTTHAGSLAGNACVDDKIFDYFAKGVLPSRKPGRGADVYCAPLPQPVPEGAPAQSSAAANSASAAAAERKLLADLVRAIRR
jgi:pimeloyl-ACP methyl ester carboxylesterase